MGVGEMLSTAAAADFTDDVAVEVGGIIDPVDALLRALGITGLPGLADPLLPGGDLLTDLLRG